MDYYNEFDAYPTQWLRNLQAAGHIPQGRVDERSIADVKAEDLEGIRSAHFFAGVGGWPLALRLAGFPEDQEVWTGSCPCQPFSVAGARKGTADKRHLWPEFLRLIGQRRPPIIFGEQVASADGRKWLAGVRTDLEGLGYAVGAADLCAAGTGEEGEGWFLRGGSVFLEPTLIGAPHIRQRLYWVAYAKDSNWRPRVGGAEEGTRAEGLGWRGPSGGSPDGGMAKSESVGHGSNGLESKPRGRERAARPYGNEMARRMADLEADRRRQISQNGRRSDGRAKAEGRPAGPGLRGASGGLGDAELGGREGRGVECRWAKADLRATSSRSRRSSWGSFDVLPCADGKARRVESGTFPLAHGVPARVGKLRAYGNAIVPEVAAVFVEAVLEVLSPR